MIEVLREDLMRKSNRADNATTGAVTRINWLWASLGLAVMAGIALNGTLVIQHWNQATQITDYRERVVILKGELDTLKAEMAAGDVLLRATAERNARRLDDLERYVYPDRRPPAR